ncbi:FAD/NAD(P)-binding domain-containing protein [Pholiota molesta]|nr:FAD/NAD(P)-binding domain-containing protein [Pholiota molesta]
MLSVNLVRGVRHTFKRTQYYQIRLATTNAGSQNSKYKVVVVGGGSGGLSVAQQIFNRFASSDKPLAPGDIAIVDGAENHYYQPGWTLVGAGLKNKTDFKRPLASLVPKYISLIAENVKSFSPKSSSVVTTTGRDISYETLVVAAGIQSNFDAIKGLPDALASPTSGVSSIYSYDTCDKVWAEIENLKSGKAVFTQPAGVIKCAGAPQKIMWMAWDRFRRTGRREAINIDFYTGMPTMFSVKKYSDALNELRQERGVGGYFEHDLVAVDPAERKATFKKADGTTISVDYSMLHVTPPMGPLNVFKGSPIADAAGWVPVDQSTLQHVNPEFSNVFALGDCSSLPTSKTAAAITAQAPVLTENLFSYVDTGKVGKAGYDGYTSCPLLTGYGQLMLAEFKYGLEPKETFNWIFDQSRPNRAFYHLKKDLFPYIYWNYMVNGAWYGTRGLSRPKF